ncbi:hypothetical protein [Neobacillus kokaensis]|uniref:HEAT repeat domain-containing protein n=1 Tax=Neobacillus kokaensis TaxID=2759023 RepID=A0ABQ3MYE8_9BACI|nr:hypothetical protein [Neobacillus kokaensis]GHH96931.1 hypothetical protein AM1BK_04740 [Neobacillus kokaensis]
MIEAKLRSILKKVKSENPEARYEALGQLFEYKQQDGIEVQMDVLKDIIKTAASPFPERVDHWDNPSYYLIDFVCDFPQPEVIEGLMKHFDGFDIQAKERAIEVLLLTEDEEIFYFLEEKIIGLMQTDDFLIPYRELTSYPMLIKGILDATLEKLDSEHYKFMLYDLLLSLNNSGVEQGYRKDVVLPILFKDYQKEKLEYLKFDKDYTTKYVYTAWKDSYFIVRSRMRLFLHLMEYYFSPEIVKELEEALEFQDPFLKTEALLVCISKNLPYQASTLLQCADDIETAEMVYWELKDKNLEHLYPILEGKQPHLAKTRLFSTIINLPEEEDGVIRYPENIQIIDKVDSENTHGQPLRYYLLMFKEHDHVYVGWAGGYALEDGDDTAHLWDGSYTDFVEFDSASIEGHKQQFFQKRDEEIQEYESSIFYESSPKLSKGAWFFLALLITHWIREIFTGFEYGTILISLLFTVIGGGFCLYEVAKNKKRKIMIIGEQLVKTEGTKQQSIGMSEIKKVAYDKKHVLIYNHKNELAFKFPKNWVRYELFYLYMKEHTGHLKNNPFIQS